MKKRKKSGTRRIVALCPHCMRQKVLTRHHVFPRRWGFQDKLILLLCRESHDEIEAIIHDEERLHKGQLPKVRYVQIAVEFVKNGYKQKRIGS